MTGIFLVGLLVLMAVVVVAALLDRLLDFDELPLSQEGETRAPAGTPLRGPSA